LAKVHAEKVHEREHEDAVQEVVQEEGQEVVQEEGQEVK